MKFGCKFQFSSSARQKQNWVEEEESLNHTSSYQYQLML